MYCSNRLVSIKHVAVSANGDDDDDNDEGEMST